MAVAQQQTTQSQPQNEETVPRTLIEVIEQVAQSLDREADTCLRVFEKRRVSNPQSANGFYKRGMYINRQFKHTQSAAVRLNQISHIMTAAYSLKADDEGMIDLDKIVLAERSKELLTKAQEYSVIPSVIHVLALGSLYRALMQYPM